MKNAQRAVFVATILVGSFLLFLVQPMVARMALPQLGGAPNVWNSAMLVYQTLLLGGYAYSHAIARLPFRKQAMIHIGVLALAGTTLPIALAEIAPAEPGWEALWVPWLFALTIGPVFFAVSAQAPLMQQWYAAHGEAKDPYPLYSASNLGSFAGLIAYPLVVEPLSSTTAQSLGWTIGYGLLLVLVILAARTRWNVEMVQTAEQPVAQAAESIGWRRIALWLALSAVPSGLMLSTTTHLTTDIFAMPLLWVIPLGLYLLSFSVAFAERQLLATAITANAAPIIIVCGGLALATAGQTSLVPAIASVALLFTAAVALHRRLYADRPDPSRLTLFYLVMSAGGALGGAFTALVAPLVFDWTWEHPILILAAALLIPGTIIPDWRTYVKASGRVHALTVALLFMLILLGASLLFHLRGGSAEKPLLTFLAFALVGLAGTALARWRWLFGAGVLAVMLATGLYHNAGRSLAGERSRSYFGIYTVEDRGAEGTNLLHGTTLHGTQPGTGEQRFAPTTYYGPTSGVGLALRAAPELFGSDARVGVVGLGVGTLACYREPGQAWTFFEIDPTVYAYSRDGTFGYLDQCTPDARVVIGDARVELAKVEPAAFDVLVIDAFSSDAIPLHLLTREAMQVYFRTLSEKGVLAVHISNRHIALQPALHALAREQGYAVQLRSDEQRGQARGLTTSDWVLLTRDAAAMQDVEAALPEGADLEALEDPADRVWTDDYASILPFLKWNNFL